MILIVGTHAVPAAPGVEPDAVWGLCVLCQSDRPLVPGTTLCVECAAVVAPRPEPAG